MATSDHGLEVLRKSAELYLGNPNELQIRTISNTGQFAAPINADYIGRSVSSNVETFVYKSGGASGTLLKTIDVTYTDATLNELVSVEVY